MKEADSITHDDFIVGYQSGRLGCSVNVLRVLALVYSGRIRESRIFTGAIAWSAGLLGLIGLWVAGFIFLPILWAILIGAVVLATFVTIAFHHLSETVLSIALSDGEFYRLILTQRALGIAADQEGNLPRLHKVVPIRNPRQARRR